MASRGKRLVALALKNVDTVDKNKATAAKESDTYRIIGSSVTNVESLLSCNENLSDSSNIQDVSDSETVETSWNSIDDFEDIGSDNSVRDPDWNCVEQSSESDDSLSSEDKTTRRQKNRITVSPPKVTEVNQHEDNTSLNIGNALNQDVNVIDHEEEVATTSAIGEKRKKCRARKGEGDPGTWKKNLNKKLRMEGKSYSGIKKVDGKNSYCAVIGQRIQGDRSCSNKCRKQKKCFDITDESRKEIFKAFWERMSWNEKSMYVANLVTRTETLTKCEGGRRNFSYKYHFRIDRNKVPVCKNFFLCTLGIGEYTVYLWLQKSDKNGLPREKTPERETAEEETPTDKNKTSSNKTTRRVCHKLNNTVSSEKAKEFLDALPKLPSHYCRANTTKMYLEPLIGTFADLYHCYVQHCVEKGYRTVGRKVFKKVFDEMNLSLFQPKKDQCDICVGYETKNVTEEQYNLHIQRKNEAREEKTKDKERAIQNNGVKVLTMDVQSVLLCPKIEASALYYKTKLACHNFTVYDMATRDVTCYFWHEGEGGLTANSFASCINYHLEKIKGQDTNEIVIYSDGCCYQNRNATLANTLLRFAVQNQVQVTQNFLEKGHTQMEVDSVHSTIERQIRHRPVNSPSNYVDMIRDARKANPYEVLYLDHTFFRDFSDLKYYTTIRPGMKVGDPVVTDIRSLRYLPTGVIQYKLVYNDEYCDLPVRRNATAPSENDAVKPLYKDKLPIKGTKYEHLQQLKSVMPRDYHPFYDLLAHN